MRLVESGLLDRLRTAREALDEDALVSALSGISADQAYPPSVCAMVTGILVDTSSPRVRNSAALAMGDMHAPGTVEWLSSALKWPGVAAQGGTLLHVLDLLRAKLSLGTLVVVLRDGSWEAREEALGFFDRGDVLPYGAAEAADATRALAEIARNLDGDARSCAESAIVSICGRRDRAPALS